MTIQQTPFIQRQRNFPRELEELSKECDLSYIDIASKINDRTIGEFALNFPTVTGEKWYISGSPKPQQTLRQFYQVTGTTPILHGINVSQIAGFVKIYGTFTDNTNWYPLPYVDPTAAKQIGIFITSNQITFVAGGSAPMIDSGYVILEWLSVF